jgi:hypothetical protein
MKKIEQDWIRHPIVAKIAEIGGLGLYVAIAVIVVIGVLEFVDARNERVWWLTLGIGRIAVIAWLGSWVVVLAVEGVNWLARRLRR